MNGMIRMTDASASRRGNKGTVSSRITEEDTANAFGLGIPVF